MILFEALDEFDRRRALAWFDRPRRDFPTPRPMAACLAAEDQLHIGVANDMADLLGAEKGRQGHDGLACGDTHDLRRRPIDVIRRQNSDPVRARATPAPTRRPR